MSLGMRNSLQFLSSPTGVAASSAQEAITTESGQVIIPRDVTCSPTGGAPSNALIISSNSCSAALYSTAMDRIKDDVMPGSQKMDGSANVGSLLRLFNSQFFDLWLAVTYLFKFENPGVVDYIANRLFEYPEEEIEFYIPQLCNLMMMRSTTNALEHFIMSRCAKSIHFAIKVYLYLNANMVDFRANSQGRLAEKLIDKVESVAVNSRFTLLPNIRAWSVTPSEKPAEENEKSPQQSPLMSQTKLSNSSSRDDLSSEPPQSPAFSGSMPRTLPGGFVTQTSPLSSKSIRIDAQSPSKVLSAITYEDPGDPFGNADASYSSVDSSKKSAVEPSSTPETSTSSLTNQDKATSQPDALVEAPQTFPSQNASSSNVTGDIASDAALETDHSGLEVHKRKGARSDYFNRVEDFLSQLNALSESLRAEPMEKRNEQLRTRLRLMNSSLPAALYIPLYTGSDLHHAVLRIPAEEAFTLKSKERVPFMLIIEVLESNNKSSNPDLFLPSFHPRLLKSAPNEPLTKHAGPFGELLEDRETRLRKFSPFGHLPSWKTFCCIVKSGDDIRQDQFALQLIEQFQRIFKKAELPLWLFTYRTLVTSSSSGYIEVVPDAISIDSLKKKIPNFTNLADYFQTAYSGSDTRQKLTLQQALNNFVESMAAYSLVSYFLQIKDRHNGNILLTYSGHVVHIDFGFMLSNSPGSMNFESAPFKLTQEFIDVMGGKDSPLFSRFRNLFVQGFLEARKHMDKVVLLVDMMMSMSQLPCFKAGKLTIDTLVRRFCVNMKEEDCVRHVNTLIDDSCDAWSTRQYDNFQYLTNGIL